MRASRTPSEIWSASLSGWPMLTDSLVNKCLPDATCALLWNTKKVVVFRETLIIVALWRREQLATCTADNPVRPIQPPNGFSQLWPRCRVGAKPLNPRLRQIHMARWPRHVWTSIFTYATVFVLFPLLCLLAYAWV